MENITADIAPLVSLRNVRIRHCTNMTCLPTGISDLPSLEELAIGELSAELDMFPFPKTDLNSDCEDDILPSLCSVNGNEIIGRRKFKSLVELELLGNGMDKVKSPPNQIKYLRQLRHLVIWGFSSLEALSLSLSLSGLAFLNQVMLHSMDLMPLCRGKPLDREQHGTR
ncbi:hypothetical protein Cgig2_015328 [Carnegiea gigantea]|uniref:Uncharacterized protein n=1 Tax=Carnegiea gigantea TaxID=171969 RepID=A0A9Q1JN63_9CARY|nr:hypothetical protein Cgig2_015328 [Carnegiea gigantea]